MEPGSKSGSTTTARPHASHPSKPSTSKADGYSCRGMRTSRSGGPRTERAARSALARRSRSATRLGMKLAEFVKKKEWQEVAIEIDGETIEFVVFDWTKIADREEDGS